MGKLQGHPSAKEQPGTAPSANARLHRQTDGSAVTNRRGLYH